MLNKILFSTLCAIGMGLPLFAETVSVKSAPKEVIVVTPDELVWKSVNLTYDPHTSTRQEAILFGDPQKAGPYALRGKIIEKGEHRERIFDNARSYYFISGNFTLTMKDAQGKTQDISLSSGDFLHIPAGYPTKLTITNTPLEWIEWAEGPRTHKLTEGTTK